jgi:hypothetical protein
VLCAVCCVLCVVCCVLCVVCCVLCVVCCVLCVVCYGDVTGVVEGRIFLTNPTRESRSKLGYSATKSSPID